MKTDDRFCPFEDSNRRGRRESTRNTRNILRIQLSSMRKINCVVNIRFVASYVESPAGRVKGHSFERPAKELISPAYKRPNSGAATGPRLNVGRSVHDASLHRLVYRSLPRACNRKLTLTPSPCHTYFKPTAVSTALADRMVREFESASGG